MTLFSLDFAVCESRKALIYKGIWRAGKTPKAEVAGSIPADALFTIACFSVSAFPFFASARRSFRSPSMLEAQGQATVRVNTRAQSCCEFREAN
jgi:hypothetical protein